MPITGVSLTRGKSYFLTLCRLSTQQASTLRATSMSFINRFIKSFKISLKYRKLEEAMHELIFQSEASLNQF